MQINLIYDRSVDNAPAGFETALNVAVQYLDHLILNPIMVNIQVGYGEDGGQRLGAGVLGESDPDLTTQTYAQVKSELAANATTSAAEAAVANLPSSDPTDGAGVEVSYAQEQSWASSPRVAVRSMAPSASPEMRHGMTIAQPVQCLPTSMISSSASPSTN